MVVDIFWLSVGGGGWRWIYFGWWWVVMDGVRYILVGGGWWWVMDIFWLVEGKGAWWWVVVDGGGLWHTLVYTKCWKICDFQTIT